MPLLHQKAVYDSIAIVRAARLGCGLHPCGALEFTRARKRGGSLEGFP